MRIEWKAPLTPDKNDELVLFILGAIPKQGKPPED
jgi:hypothetical protein